MSARITDSGNTRTTAAGRRLAELLVVRPAYRTRWMRQLRRQDTLRHGFSTVHQAAVARVLADHLWRDEQVPVTDRALPRRLKDLVQRALTGQVLSARTLDLFARAFAMSAVDVEELQALLQPPGIPATGSQAGPAPGRGPADSWPGPQPESGLRTVALREAWSLGPDGRPRMLHSIHVVRAVGTLPGYRYVLDPGGIDLRVLRGGQATPVRPPGPSTAVDVTFHRPLRPGQTTSVESVGRFAVAGTPVTRLLRGTTGRLENVELQVRFHPTLLPDRVWWTVWPGPAVMHPLCAEPVGLDPDGTAHLFLDAVEAQAVGFHWRFAS
ncbi:MAG TPA: hypothetical protein VFP72_11305 [Kineosporiaceae bacterium]|nr:hypothetical protein [Kineosporiaceae bacterium]